MPNASQRAVNKPHARARNHIANVKKAARNTVQSQILRFKAESCIDGQIECAITRELCDWNDIHVDHDFGKLPFSALFKGWLQRENKVQDDILVTGDGRDRYFTDADARSWGTFHQEHALLRCIRVDLNLHAKRGKPCDPGPFERINLLQSIQLYILVPSCYFSTFHSLPKPHRLFLEFFSPYPSLTSPPIL